MHHAWNLVHKEGFRVANPIGRVPMNQSHDDDGIIDFRALASTPPPRGAFAMPSPFASDPPPAFSLDASDADGERAPTRGSKAKTIAIVVASAAFLALGCVGVGFAFRGAKAAPARAAAVVAPPAAAPVAAPPAPAAEPAPVAAAPASSAAVDPPTAEAASTKKGKNGKARAGGARSTKAPAAPVTKAPVTKASDPCNCHGDFQCNIRCAANK